jgi:hypothetical protein
MTAPTAAAHEERARDIFRRLFDERDLTTRAGTGRTASSRACTPST